MKTFDEWFDSRNFDPSLYSPMSHAWSAGCGTSAEKLQAYRRAILAAIDAAKSAKAVSGWDNVPYDIQVEIDKIFSALAKVGADKGDRNERTHERAV